MFKYIKKMISDKKEFKNQMERVESLPEDYKFVFNKMHEYMWRHAGGDGSEMIKTQGDLIDLFENSAADKKHVLDITGEDVAGFYDEFLRDTRKWTDYYGKKLNKKITNKIESGKE